MSEISASNIYYDMNNYMMMKHEAIKGPLKSDSIKIFYCTYKTYTFTQKMEQIQYHGVVIGNEM